MTTFGPATRTMVQHDPSTMPLIIGHHGPIFRKTKLFVDVP